MYYKRLYYKWLYYKALLLSAVIMSMRIIGPIKMIESKSIFGKALGIFGSFV
jgi:hypothetical protein